MRIINLHGVGCPPRDASPGEQACWLSRDTLEQVLDLVVNHSNVQITVDDGNLSDIYLILPELLRRDLKATFCLCAGRLEETSFVSRANVRELLGQGMRIASHGLHHLSWRAIDPYLLARELVESRKILEDLCERSIDSAACPYGAYDRAVLKAVKKSGYTRVYTSDGGDSDENCWVMARTTITKRTSLVDLKQFIEHGPGFARQSVIDLRKLVKRLR